MPLLVLAWPWLAPDWLTESTRTAWVVDRLSVPTHEPGHGSSGLGSTCVKVNVLLAGSRVPLAFWVSTQKTGDLRRAYKQHFPLASAKSLVLLLMLIGNSSSLLAVAEGFVAVALAEQVDSRPT